MLMTAEQAREVALDNLNYPNEFDVYIDKQITEVVSPNVAVRMLEEDEQSSESMLICMFAPEDTALVVKAEDWDTMVDNGELFVRKGDE